MKTIEESGEVTPGNRVLSDSIEQTRDITAALTAALSAASRAGEWTTVAELARALAALSRD